MKKLQIPVGISDFTKIREQGYYYVDKTGLISDLLEDIAEVTLITRPRRFGKTMGMSMLANFFDIHKDSTALFEGLEISRNAALCKAWQNQWPVLFVTFKDIDGLTFASAKEMLIERVATLCKMHSYLAFSDQINPDDRKIFQKLSDLVNGKPTDAMLKTSLSLLMQMMKAHYGKPVILLIAAAVIVFHKVLPTLQNGIFAGQSAAAESLTLDQLAEQFFISKYHLLRKFDAQVGTTVHRYILQKRLLNAKQLLAGGVPPNEVCQYCGFGDYANFYRAFRAEYNQTPRQYIQSARGK